MLEKTFRITPNPSSCSSKKNDIVLDYVKKKFIENPRVRKFLLAKEFTTKEGLHYHGYISCDYSVASVRKLIQKMCKKQYKGNGFCSIKGGDVGDYWKNYICKDGDILYHKGFTKKDIKKAIKEGQKYKEIGKLLKMNWKQRVFYYLEEKGLKDKWLSIYVSKRLFNIDENLLPVVLQISTECKINPPPPPTYQSVKMSVIRVIFPEAFKRWYIDYIHESLKYKGPNCLINPSYSSNKSWNSYESSSDDSETDLLEDCIEKNKKKPKIKEI